MSRTTHRNLLILTLCIIALAALVHVLAGIALLWAWLLSATAVAFTAMSYDKWRACRNKWRTPEAALLFTAALGGTAGVSLAILVTGHKRRSKAFLGILGLILIAQAAAGIFAWQYGWRP